mmetsp:Transcript_13516/g.40869  ORF Transcript_13516/g.40869 Transcript_13516/m.40869 type:complete len:286 (-) Transcript_13516:281-1138(-)
MPDEVAAALDRLASVGDSPTDTEALRFHTSIGEGRQDTDHTGAPCTVVDCVVNSAVMEHAEHLRTLKTFVSLLLMSSVAKKLGVRLDERGYKLPRMRYKGAAGPQPQHIRKDPRSLVEEVVDPKSSTPGFALRLDRKPRPAAAPGKAAGASSPTAAPAARSQPGRDAKPAATSTVAPTAADSGLSHSVRFEGSPAEAAVVEVRGAAGASPPTPAEVRVSVCCEQVTVCLAGSRTLQVQLPFAVDADKAVAEVGAGGGALVTIRLPYQPYSAILQQPPQPAAIATH